MVVVIIELKRMENAGSGRMREDHLSAGFRALNIPLH